MYCEGYNIYYLITAIELYNYNQVIYNKLITSLEIKYLTVDVNYSILPFSGIHFLCALSNSLDDYIKIINMYLSEFLYKKLYKLSDSIMYNPFDGISIDSFRVYRVCDYEYLYIKLLFVLYRTPKTRYIDIDCEIDCIVIDYMV